jgi:hypothetical protein
VNILATGLNVNSALEHQFVNITVLDVVVKIVMVVRFVSIKLREEGVLYVGDQGSVNMIRESLNVNYVRVVQFVIMENLENDVLIVVVHKYVHTIY